MGLQRLRRGTRPRRERCQEHSRGGTSPSCRRNPRPLGRGGCQRAHLPAYLQTAFNAHSGHPIISLALCRKSATNPLTIDLHLHPPGAFSRFFWCRHCHHPTPVNLPVKSPCIQIHVHQSRTVKNWWMVALTRCFLTKTHTEGMLLFYFYCWLVPRAGGENNVFTPFFCLPGNFS